MIKKRLSYEDWQHIYSKGSRFGCSSALTYKGLKDSVKICLKNLDFEVDFSRKGFSEIIKNAILLMIGTFMFLPIFILMIKNVIVLVNQREGL